MILQWFAEMFYKIFTTLLSWIHLPSLANDIKEGINSFIDIIFGNAWVIFDMFIPHSIISVGIPIILAVSVFKYGYYFVMWIIKKIPMASIN